MLLRKPDFEFIDDIDGAAMLRKIEQIGRVCYKTEDRIGPGTAEKFCRMLMGRKPPHLSVIEHCSVTVKFIIDRGVSHELVRHRLAAYSQESTRFCNYGKKGIVYIIPPWVDCPAGDYNWDNHMTWNGAARVWLRSLLQAENAYNDLLQLGWTPEKARDVLPISLKTEVVATYNLREWRHVFFMRTMEVAHPQMREVMVPLLAEFKRQIPILFDDL